MLCYASRPPCLSVNCCSTEGHLRSGCSGMAMRSHSRLTLYWLLTLEVLLPKGWRGMVPMTSGSSRHSLDVPGTSTQTWCEEKLRTFIRCRVQIQKTAAVLTDGGSQKQQLAELTLSMYSTLMMRHCRMEGPTGGILMARPCHVSLHLAPTMSPHSVPTTERFCFMVPRAMNVCV